MKTKPILQFVLVVAFVALATAAFAVTNQAAYKHCIYDSMPLDGAWEMAYRSNAWESVEYPRFKGVEIKNAVPGFWEDMIPAFRAAGMTDSFWMNPQYATTRFPIMKQYPLAPDITIPGIYGCFFYRKTVRLDEVRPAVIAFEGVRNQVHLWVNGKFAASHQSFSTPFELAIPEGLLRKGDNEIILAVANRTNDGYGGRRVRSGLSVRAIFACTGGIDGKVALRFPKNSVSDIYVTTAMDLGSFTVHVGGAGKDGFSWEILDGDNKVVADGRAQGDFTLPSDGFKFWSPESPVRYTLRIKTPQGECSQKFGIRRLVADGEKLRFNGKFVFLRGVTELCYFPKTVHIPRDIGYYRMMMSKRKELGFNFVRLHTFIPPAEYLEAADELGLIVQIESPNYVTQEEYKAIIAFARSHPCVAIYCTGNETLVDAAAEKYLEEVAGIVHRETDALFTPLNALNGVDWMPRKRQRGYVEKPFPHDRLKLGRLAKYSDLFINHNDGTSHYSLERFSVADIDARGDAYFGRPRLLHEICINGTFADLSLEKDYPPDSPILATGFLSEVGKQLESKGLADKAEIYAKNSAEWMRRIRKFTFEKVRAMKRIAGYDFLGDINGHWHSYGYFVGMRDEFFRLKSGETVENVLRYNSPAVLLCDLGKDFNTTAGKAKRVGFSLSNYDADAPEGTLRISLAGENGEEVWSAEAKTYAVRCGDVTKIGGFEVMMPAAEKPAKYLLRATFSAGKVKASNEWEMYAFPRVAEKAPAAGDADGGREARIVENISKGELLAAMERGERVLLLGAGPFKSRPTTFQIISAGRGGAERNSATVVKAGHPALGDFPHEGFCGWQFRRLMEGGRSVQLEGDIPFDPVVDMVGSDKFIIRQSSLFEYRVGKGRLLVCSFRFDSGDPAAAWLKNRLVEYVRSDAFAPKHAISAGQLRAVIEARRSLDEKFKKESININTNDPATKRR